MAPDVAIEPVLDAPLRVDPAAIEGELQRIWTETASAGMDESTVRLRVVNFVAVGEDSVIDRFERVMQTLPAQHPARGLAVSLSPARRGVEAAISAQCWRGDGGRHLCSELVELRGGTQDEGALASLVLSLLVPELPVAVWLIGAHDARGRLVSDLLDSSDRLFVDSAEAPAPMAMLEATAGAAAEHEVALYDLAWCRNDGWRELTAQFFDGEDGARRLDRIESISVVGGRSEASSAALLTAGWLVSSLALEPADVERAGGSLRATLYDASRGVRLGVLPDPRGGLDLASIKLRADGVDFSVQYHPESGHMHVREEWPDGPSHRTVAPTPADDASVFGDALDDTAAPALFGKALAAALALANAE